MKKRKLLKILATICILVFLMAMFVPAVVAKDINSDRNHAKEEYEKNRKQAEEQYDKAMKEAAKELEQSAPQNISNTKEPVTGTMYAKWYSPTYGYTNYGGAGIGYSTAYSSMTGRSHIIARAEVYGTYWATAQHWVKFTYNESDAWHRVNASYFLRGNLMGGNAVGQGSSSIKVRLQVWDHTTNSLSEIKDLLYDPQSGWYSVYYDGNYSGYLNVLLKKGHVYSISLIYDVNASGLLQGAAHSDFQSTQFNGLQRQVAWNWVELTKI